MSKVSNARDIKRCVIKNTRGCPSFILILYSPSPFLYIYISIFTGFAIPIPLFIVFVSIPTSPPSPFDRARNGAKSFFDQYQFRGEFKTNLN